MSSPLLDTVTAYIEDQGGGQGLFPTPVDGFNIVRSFQAMMPMRQIYRPSLCVVLKGAKELCFGENRLDYGAMEYLVVSVNLPATGRIVEASEEAPYVGVLIDFDVATLRGVLEQLDEAPVRTAASAPGAFVGKVDEPLVECIFRLMRMTRAPKSIPVLHSSVMRDIGYWLLSGPYGSELCKLALPESNVERVVRAIAMLHANFTKTLRVEDLADTARMSLSSFHHHFKALTSMTPLQFQKQLRLLEAKRLMMSEAVGVAEAAYLVGYESASQFSREYSRNFGVAPKRDAMNQLRLYSEYASRSIAAE